MGQILFRPQEPENKGIRYEHFKSHYIKNIFISPRNYILKICNIIFIIIKSFTSLNQ